MALRMSGLGWGCILVACSHAAGDLPADAGAPSLVGSGSRIREITSLAKPGSPAPDRQVSITGAVVTHVDEFDETGRGARGTVYVQDLGKPEPWSGISLFTPSFVPGDLRVAPGDVVDLVGAYQENSSIGTANFDGELLIQLSRPVVTHRAELTPPEPVVIDVRDLLTYETGRKWMGMLVTVRDVALVAPLAADSAGRVSAVIAGEAANRDAPTITNELYPLTTDAFPAGTRFRSITGLVTYFFRLHIAPRSAKDLEP